jgi:hypothetical protein
MNHHSPAKKIIATSAISFAREKKFGALAAN